MAKSSLRSVYDLMAGDRVATVMGYLSDIHTMSIFIPHLYTVQRTTVQRTVFIQLHRLGNAI